MGLRDDILDDVSDAWFDTGDFAETVTYTPKGGSGSSIVATVNYGGDWTEDGRYFIEEMTALIQASDVADPEPNDTIDVDSVSWTVREVESAPLGLFHFVKCTRNERVST